MQKNHKHNARLAAFLVPPALGLVLLYHPLAGLQITVRQPETLWIIGGVLGSGLILGLAAAFGGSAVRAVVLAVTAVVWIDMALPLPSLLDQLVPDETAARRRDQQRISDIRTIQRALEAYTAAYGPLPRPEDYGEQTGPSNFWANWWDVSGQDEDGDGVPFLDFLVDSGVLLSVPLDPINRAADDGHPTGGSQYAYFVAPAGYEYEGGQCSAHRGYSTYLIGITDLERERSRPPGRARDSGCDCLWRDKPNFFDQYFDYVLCGRFRP